MIHRNRIFFEIYRILRDTKKPLSQKQIIDKLVERGYKRTTCVNLFNPSVIQPLFLTDGKIKDFAHPLVEKVQSISEVRLYFKLNPKWKEVSENDAKEKLVVVD